jgi:carboxypeptidase D
MFASIVVPQDGNTYGNSAYTATRDDDIFIQVALTYSKSNPVMFASKSFPNGITNGAAWYTLYGGMQDVRRS